MRILITFAYNERSGKDSEFNKNNLRFFLKCGIIDNENYQYNFVINGSRCSVEIPAAKNISVIKRNNIGYDFGAYESSVNSVNIEDYDYFIFINDTARGPFIPTYTPKKMTWADMFIDKIDENIKLVGPVGSFLLGHHIQSMCFGTDLEGLKIIRGNDNLFIVNDELEKQEIIKNHELGMSKRIIEHGYELGPFNLSQYEDVGIQKKSGGIHRENAYYGATLNPIEIMFIKTNRINDIYVNNYTRWEMRKGK